MNYFGIYQRLLTAIPFLNFESSDIVINTNGNSLPFNLPPNILCILYIHFPAFLHDSLNTLIINTNKLYFGKPYFKPYQFMTIYLLKEL